MVKRLPDFSNSLIVLVLRSVHGCDRSSWEMRWNSAEIRMSDRSSRGMRWNSRNPNERQEFQRDAVGILEIRIFGRVFFRIP